MASSKKTDDDAQKNTDSSNAKGLPLDWTKMGQPSDSVRPVVIRLPSDVADVRSTEHETELCIVGTAGQKITHIGGDLACVCSPNLERLILRSHLITTVEGLQGFRNLSLLELYDNSIKSLDGLCEGEEDVPGSTLTTLDMSYNVIKDMSPVASCLQLTELYLAQNKLKEIRGLKTLKSLRKLDLGANRIRVMEEDELSGLVSLEELWLGKNKIENIGGIEKLTKLRRLDVQANRLTVVENLTTQKDTLEELYLSHNNIGNRGASQPTGLALEFSALTTLDLSRNRISTTSLFVHLTNLTDLWLSSNKITTFDDVEPISQLHQIESIYLEYNPVANEYDYRLRLASINPNLQQIDANMIAGRSGFGGVATYDASSSSGTKELLSSLVSDGTKSTEAIENLNRKRLEMAVDRARTETEAKKNEALSMQGDLEIDENSD